jgi:plastocyanin
MKNITTYKKPILSGIALLAILMISFSCSKSSNAYMNPATNTTGGTTGPGANEVFIQGMAFVPSTISVAAGTTITWTNKDAIGHTVTSNDNLFNSGTLGTGKSFTFTFAKAGSFGYYCSIHTTMTASVTVN